MSEDKVSVNILGHGLYEAPAFIVDAMIAKHLPSSSYKLRQLVEKRSGLDWSDVQDMTTFLIVLADWEHASLLSSR